MTDTLDIGALTLPEGYFLIREPRVRRAPYVPRENGRGQSSMHVFSYAGSQPAIKEAALELLASARRKVFLASFRIGEPDLLDALYAAVARLRGGVYVISALDERTLRRGLMVEAADAPEHGDIRAQNKRFEDLTSRGIAVRGHEHCHAKFLVVDDRVALVSSANLETSALVGSEGRPVTSESGVVVSQPQEVARLSRFFTRLWYTCPFELPPGETHTVQRRPPAPSPCRVPVPAVGPRAGVIWTHEDERVILETIHDVISRARHRLLLTTFSLNGLTDRPELLLEPLERAMSARPLRVALLARSRNHLDTHRRDAAALAALGVRVHGDSLNHAKAAIADECHGALFSANFDTEHGLRSGVEVGVRLDGDSALAEARRYVEHAIANADVTFAAQPKQREMNQRLAAAWCACWPFEADVRVTASDRTWERLRAATVSAPVLFTIERNERVKIIAGGGCWTLGDRASGGLRRLEQAHRASGEGAAQLLRSWLLSPPRGERRDEGSRDRRGFCPAVFRRMSTD